MYLASKLQVLLVRPDSSEWSSFSFPLQSSVQSHLVTLQPQFKTNLLESVDVYKHDLTSFLDNYGQVGHAVHSTNTMDTILISGTSLLKIKYSLPPSTSVWSHGVRAAPPGG